ncbi:MAG: hypothetical protein CMO80_24650 [Verrucomicrobiales bacterium]|nr:hypothetical protein [Verrucomicrobiales bacterium]
MKKLILLSLALSLQLASADFRAGAIVLDVSPLEFPVLVNGGMMSRSAKEVNDPINARALVIADGKTQIAIVVVDSCMLAKPVLDEAKKLASKRTGIPMDHMLISATHTHSAPSTLGCLGTRADPRYTPYLVQKLAEAIAKAQKKLQPAKVGWNNVNAAEYTALRRWVHHPRYLVKDPFGNPTGRANMHSGRDWSRVTGESGPEDPDLNMISIQTRDGKPLALLANFSMHYFSGVRPLSADYFGRWASNVKQRLAPDSEFVAMMSHGCSGDIWRRDYGVQNWAKNPVPKDKDFTVDSYAEQLADRAVQGYAKIKHTEDADLAMEETRMRLNYRTPDTQLLEWSERIVKETGDRDPKTSTEVYAMEQTILHKRQNTEIVLQAIRIGDIGITTTPNETYALTALKLKAMSPLKNTMVIELANGGDGYIPPPEQHVLGGYNTWAARSAGLEVQAEPKIVEADLQMLEKVAGKLRRPHSPATGSAAKALLAANPAAYWRLDEFSGPLAHDRSGNDRTGMFEDGVVFHLEGARSKAFNKAGELNRAAHFCGGRMRAQLSGLKNDYSVSLWFWNGMPDGLRDIAGWMFSRDRDHALGPFGDHLGLGGDGKLVLRHGSGKAAKGNSTIKRWTWTHVVLVRDGKTLRVFLNGENKPELELDTDGSFPAGFESVFVGGRSDRVDNWEGRLDEAAIFDRALSIREISRLAVR